MKTWIVRAVLLPALLAALAGCGGAAGELSTYTLPDGQVTFNYPSDWLVRASADNSVITLANSATALDAAGSLPSGAVLVTLTLLPPELYAGTDAPPLAELLRGLVSTFPVMTPGGSGTGMVRQLDVSGIPVARIDSSGQGGEALFLLFENKRQFVFLAAAAPAGELRAHEPAIYGIVQTFAYEAE